MSYQVLFPAFGMLFADGGMAAAVVSDIVKIGFNFVIYTVKKLQYRPSQKAQHRED